MWEGEKIPTVGVPYDSFGLIMRMGQSWTLQRGLERRFVRV